MAVSSVSAALELLEKADARRFDVLVSDIGLPKEDEYELMRRVRALDAGYQVHVAKPIDPVLLVSAVQAALLWPQAEGAGELRR